MCRILQTRLDDALLSGTALYDINRLTALLGQDDVLGNHQCAVHAGNDDLGLHEHAGTQQPIGILYRQHCLEGARGRLDGRRNLIDMPIQGIVREGVVHHPYSLIHMHTAQVLAGQIHLHE